MKGTDPWGRGHPPGLRTQGRGFNSRWVRFSGQGSTCRSSVILYNSLTHRAIYCLTGPFLQDPNNPLQQNRPLKGVMQVVNGSREFDSLITATFSINLKNTGRRYQRPPCLPCERPPALLLKIRTAPITATIPIPANPRYIQLKFCCIGITSDVVLFDELISCSMTT